jgi:hypothetical protein
MSYRGRLIWPFRATIERLDTQATAANPGPTAGGYDHDFKEPRKRADGTTNTVYMAPIILNCQVETEADDFDALAMRRGGDNRDSEVKLVFHFQELEDHGLVDDHGRALMSKGDRLVAIHTQNREEVDNYAELHLVATNLQPRSYGLSGLKRNLLLVSYRRRDRSSIEV